MQLIEAFYYSLKLEADDLFKKEQEAKSKIDATTEAMEKQDKGAESLGKGFLGLAAKVGTLVAAYASWAAIKGAALQAADDTNALSDQARSMYLSADELRTWQGAVVSAGGTAEGLNATLKTLSERTKDPLGALEKVADRFRGLTDRQADRLGKSLGIDQSMVDVLRLGTAGLQERIKMQMRLGEVTQEQIDIARKYKIVLADTNVVFDDVRRRIMALVLPALIQWMEGLQKIVIWIREHGTFVGTFFGVVAAAITAVLIPAIVRLGLVWARTAVAFLATPLGALLAALVAIAGAIALIVDDIAAFEAGGKSLIGDIAARWPVVGDIVHNIVDALKMLWEVARSVFQYLKDVIYEPDVALANLHKRLGVVFDAMEKRFPALAAVVKVVASNIKDFVTGIIDVFSNLFTIVSKVFNFIKDSFVGDAFKWAGDKISGAIAGTELGKQMSAPSDGKRYSLPSDEEIAAQRKAVAANPAAVPPLVIEAPKLPPGYIAAPHERDDVPPAMPPKEQVETTARAAVAATVEAGKNAVVAADRQPTNSMTSNSIINNTSNKPTQNRTVQVTTGPITIQTQATNGSEVGAAVGKGIQDHIKQANDEFDTGVAI